MSQKNFSLLLALRYLNPIRTNVSVITVISLLGVAAGVMVLIVTLSVMTGFENLLKNIVLTSQPHIYLEHRSQADGSKAIEKESWQEMKVKLEKEDFIKSVSPKVSSFVVIEIRDSLLPRLMTGIDTMNDDEIKKFEEVIEEGDASKLQEGNNIVISSRLRDETGMQIGDKVLVHSSGTLKKLQPILNRIDKPLFAETQHEALAHFEEAFKNDNLWEITDSNEVISFDIIQPLVNNFIIPSFKHDRSLRAAERDIMQKISSSIANQSDKNEINNNMEYVVGTRSFILEQIEELRGLDMKTIDDRELREVKEFALPKELIVVGVSISNNFAKGTDMFVPFDIAQDLADTDGGIQGLSLTIDQPYRAGEIKEKLLALEYFNFSGDRQDLFNKPTSQWTLYTWMESSSELFKIMEMQKFMMVFVLSFIVLIAVFSIAAVMFTVAIQKKREIGVMKALGATPRQIINVFAYQGFIVGAIGSLIGVGLGYIVSANVGPIQQFIKNTLHFNPFPKSIYGTDTMPSEIVPMEILIIAVGALVLCTLASLIPAWAASRADAARSLRNL